MEKGKSQKEIEEKIFQFWEKNKIYEKAKAQRKKARKFYFLDGPPYATGSIHVGTAMNKVIKDCYLRFFRMFGFNVWDQPGYDTHGVPIENKIEKELGFKSKKDIEKFGVAKFIQKCREFATKYIDVMGKQFENLGVWMDWKNPYLTLTNDYIEGAWYTFKKAFEKGFLYKGNYPVHVCPRCVDLNSEVLVEDGTKKIKELENCWKHNLPIVFDAERKKITNSNFNGYVKYDDETYTLQTIAGRKIIATPDHPFFVEGKGWVELRNISVGNRVAVYPHIKTIEEKTKSFKIVGEKEILKTLKNIEIACGLKRIGETSSIIKLTTLEREKVVKFIRECMERRFSYSNIIKKVRKKYGLKISKSLISKISSSSISLRSFLLIKKLKEMGLIPLMSDSPKLVILARILGHIFGDGSVIIRKGKGRLFPSITLVFTGREEDLKTIMKDIDKLGFDYSKIEKKKVVSTVNGRKIKGISTSFSVNSLGLSILLLSLGAPTGKKTSCNLEFPKPILNASKKVKQAFISSYFGSELQILPLRKHKKGFNAPRFYLHRDMGQEKDGIKFVRTICKILKEFEINAKYRIKRVLVNKKPKIKITCEIESDDENILNLCEKIGYTYCKYRELRAKLASSYLKYKLNLKREIENQKKRILELKKKGLKPVEISKFLNLPIRKVRYVYYEYEKTARSSPYIEDFLTWIKLYTKGLSDGLVWDIVKEISPSGKRTVADVGVENFHSFIVNEFVTHNCETVVAYNEIEYTKLTDPSIYVKFRVKNKPNEFLVIWTTTPWTLPANTGVMAKPDAEYVRVQVGNEILILAKALVDKVMEKAGIKDYKILETKTGRELENLKYEHPFINELKFQQVLTNAHRVVLSDQFVSLEEGTGLVHTAPGHGEEDYKVGLETGLPAISPVKIDGTFDESCGKYAGMFVKEADKLILQDLRAKGLLLHEETIQHDYPICWRCNSPLIQISVPQWFFKVTAIRDKLIEENKKIKWNPEWASQRFQNWLESLGDWPISRQRYWGIPLPIWVCEKCGHIKVIGSREELPKVPKDFHKPYIDEITLKCSCGGKMKRVPDVLDVWFDSGVASWASLGFPRNKKLFKKFWPADFILEGADQFRGWWNSLMITSMMTFGRAPFKSVLMHGLVLDAHGQKMSKSLQNIVSTEEVIEKYGRDLLRFYYLSSEPWNDYYFSWQALEEISKNFVVVRNTFNFVKTYVTSKGKPKGLKQEDKWILSKLNSLIENCTKHFNDHNAHKASNEILDFILNDFSRWYIKIIRDRVWPLYDGKDKQAAFFTLLTVTENLAKLLAPICPFLAEQVYQDVVKPLKKGKLSVHLEDWPKAEKRMIDKKLEEEMKIAKQIVEACSAARQKVNLKLRWPVASVIVVSKDKKVLATIKDLKEVLLKMCNSKKIEVAGNEPKGEFSGIEFNLGKVFVPSRLDEKLLNEALLRELVRKIQEMRKKFGFVVKDRIDLSLSSDEKTNKILEKNKKMIAKEVGAKIVVVGATKGKFSDSLEFEDKKISIAFNKTQSS